MRNLYFTDRSLQFSKITHKSLGSSFSLSPLFFLSLLPWRFLLCFFHRQHSPNPYPPPLPLSLSLSLSFSPGGGAAQAWACRRAARAAARLGVGARASARGSGGGRRRRPGGSSEPKAGKAARLEREQAAGVAGAGHAGRRRSGSRRAARASRADPGGCWCWCAHAGERRPQRCGRAGVARPGAARRGSGLGRWRAERERLGHRRMRSSARLRWHAYAARRGCWRGNWSDGAAGAERARGRRGARCAGGVGMRAQEYAGAGGRHWCEARGVSGAWDRWRAGAEWHA
jgi:hypothetical protein